MKILDFTDCGFGLLVTHSKHFNKEHCIKSRKKDIGIIIDKSFYSDKKGGAVCWPSVRWEGSVTESLCHPINVIPYRKHNLPEKEIEE